MLKASFPLAIHAHEATYETMYGVVRRPTHRNTSWDAARFEVAAYRFVDLSETGYGVALLNDGKYGFGVHENVLTMSMVRGPMYPDPFAGEGEHHFTYSLVPHGGDWTTAGVSQRAFALNSPLVVTESSAGGAMSVQFVRCQGVELQIGALKQAEDGDHAILRLYEPNGARGVATLEFTEALTAVTAVDLQEEATAGVHLVRRSERSFELTVRPFQIVTLRLEFAR